MGFINKSIAQISQLTNKFFEFGDGNAAPLHGSFQVDALSKLPERSRLSTDLYERFVREGDPVSWDAYSAAPVSVATGAVNTSLNVTAQSLPTIGKAIWIEEITVSLNAPGVVQLQIPASADGLFPGFLKRIIIGNTPVSVPVKQMVRGFNFNNNANITLNIRNNLTTGSVDYYGCVSVSGWRIADDFDFDADVTILVVGDSILNGTAGATLTANMWAFKFKQYLLSTHGIRARIVLKSVSGSASANHEKWRAGGYHDIERADLVLYAVGVNDAGSAVTDGVYVANLTAFHQWVEKRYPSATMIAFGVSPLENNTSETRAVGLRTATQAYVTGASSDRLKYINLGAAFDRTVTTNYASSDTPGSRVHPSDIGHAAIESVIESAWTGLSINLKP